VLVGDPEQALGRLAHGVLGRTSARVVGVTGSSGKTSTKDLIAQVLARGGPTVAAEGSFNNEVGLPLTVLAVDAGTAYLVLEYSARGIGHIAYLAGIARPDIAVVLNVGTAHLGEFGSPEGIAIAKGELVEALTPDGTAVLNLDDPLVAAMRGRTAARVVGVGTAPDAEIRIEDLTTDELARPRFRLRTPAGPADMTLGLHGAHHAGNAAAAAAVGLAVGMPLADVVAALAAAVPRSAHRMAVQARADGLLVVDDAYNANPESMHAALDALVRLGAGRGGETWAVLGEMRELGGDAPTLHAAVGRRAAELGVDHLVVVGDGAAAIEAGARAVPGWRGEAVTVGGIEVAAALLGGAGGKDTVLVKASNALQLWRVAEHLLETPDSRTDSAGPAA
jgi:UDP-N-acetylmuramoyl-tripeptide--D-alanyl-D-alanine ligase